jgi:sugar-phosphatase
MITASDVSIGKPDPEPYLKAAERLGFAAADCVVVEDAPAGVLAGKAAGARVIALTTTMIRSQLEAVGADWVVRSCADITVDGDVEHGLRLRLSV